MALTEAQVKSRILMLVGDCDNAGNPISNGTGVVATNIDLVWDTYTGFNNRIRELYCRRDLIMAVISRIGLTADTAIGRDLGLSVRKSDRAKAYQEMLDRVLVEIKAVAVGAAFSGLTTNAIDQLTTVTPVADEDRAQFVEDLR